MRPLTPAELRLLLERGVEALDDWKPAEIVASLALEVSERRLAEVAVRSRCSFCGRDRTSIKYLIAATAASICSWCVSDCVGIAAVDSAAKVAEAHGCHCKHKKVHAPHCPLSLAAEIRGPFEVMSPDARAAETGIGEGGK